MKRILITGANSYIGMSFERWMSQYSHNYVIDTLDMRDPSWQDKDLSLYDVVFHVAGIAHADVSKVSDKTKQLYYDVNTNLTIQTAEKYKRDLKGKTGQFIFMSSIIIYGEETNINKKRIITRNTEPNPSNFYGDSKLQAEIGISLINDDTFKVAILRPPMIYGAGSKGNYQQLKKIAKVFPVFPDVRNERSVLSIENLCIFLKERVDTQDSGIFFPQDEEYIRTSFLVRDIAKNNRKKVILFSWMNWIVSLLGYVPGKIGKLTNKAFGNLVYSKECKKKKITVKIIEDSKEK